MAKYHLAIIRPQGYQHSDCFVEVAASLEAALRELGHTAVLAENSIDTQATTIVLGAHLLEEREVAMLSASVIVYNLEKLDHTSLPSWYLGLAARCRIWDYSPLNLERWQSIACLAPPLLVEIGYDAVLRRIPRAPVEDIDVLFYGSQNERRTGILRSLEQAGLKVHIAFGVYGKERDALISRAKVVLNLHLRDGDAFEIVRVSYLLANSKAVVTESSPDLGSLAAAVEALPYDQIVRGCVALVREDARRHALEAEGFRLFSQRRQAALLRHAVPTDQGASACPRRLNLGSGKDWREDCLNIDINDYWKPDAVLDISQPMAPDLTLATARFGSVKLGPGVFDEILANDVLEHIPNLTAAMTAALHLLSVGGDFQIKVPYDLALGAWQDPTHVRAFNERSWLYYTEWFWYLGWTEARFTIHTLEFELSPVGEALRMRLSSEEVARTPRAIDSMRITLRKQSLSPAERSFVTNFLKRPERGFSASAAAQALPAAALPQPEPAVATLRKLYLDMIERTVINLVYEDPNQNRWSPHTFNPQLRENGRDWPAQAHSMIGRQRMANLRTLAEQVLANSVEGDFIETGVWRGGACILMRAVLAAYSVPDRRVWVADSFKGLPPPNPGIAADFADQHHTFTELAVSLAQVQRNFEKYDLLDDQVCFLEGWFADTLAQAPIEKLALLRLDGDMYGSTMDALQALYDKVSPGGYIIVDDYGAVAGCQKAIHDFRRQRGIQDPLQDIDGWGAFWQKESAPARPFPPQLKTRRQEETLATAPA